MALHNTLKTPAEVSTILGVPESTLAVWRGQGKGPKFIKITHKVRYGLADLETWLNEQRRQHTNEPEGQHMATA